MSDESKAQNEGFDEVDKAFVDSLIPDNAIDAEMVAVISWTNLETGGKTFVTYTCPVRNLESAVGQLELAKARLIRDHLWACDEDDD